jgi:hypothetical protein
VAFGAGFWLAACGGKSEATKSAPFVAHGDSLFVFGSGARLKAHYLDGGGGARQLLAFHDIQLDLECNFVATSAGQYACLPVTQTGSFSDAACTAPTFTDQSSCASPHSAGELISARSNDCAAQVGAYSLVAEQEQAQSYAVSYYGGCSASTPSSPVPTAWTTQPESLARFVQGTLSIVGAPSGTQATRVTGSDGAFVDLGLVAAGVPCTPIQIDGMQRCVPEPIAQLLYYTYSDSSCTRQDIALVGRTIAAQCAGTLPRYLVESTSSDCSVQSVIYALEEPPTQLYTGVDTCAAYTPVGSLFKPLYRAGSRVAPTSFALAHSVSVGSSEVTLDCFADDAGTPIALVGAIGRAGSWALKGGPTCFALADANGQRRCLSNLLGFGTPTSFSDENCTQAIYSDDVGCAGSIAYLVDATYATCVPSFTEVFVAKPYMGPVYTTQSGSCQLSEFPANAGNPPYFMPGDPVDPSAFPAINELTDP